MGRRILHADFNGFYASVACFLDPSLRPHPVAVAGNPEARHGIILAKNELAKAFGVKTGEAIWQAKQKCPLLVTVKPDFAMYQKFSAMGREIYGEYSDRVEAFGLDESWIDVSSATTGMRDAARLADVIRTRIKNELGITISVGVADNKVFAKLGSDIKKPDAVTLVSPDNYQSVAWPLAARELLYVGRATEAKLLKYGIATIGDLANTPESFLRAQFGKCGSMLHAFANGLDAAPVLHTVDQQPVKSVGNGLTTPRDLVNDEDVYLTISMLAESVAARLREHGMRAKTAHLGVRDTGLVSFIRQTRLDRPTNITIEISRACMRLFHENYSWQTPIRSLSVSCSDLIGPDNPEQLSLFDDEAPRRRAEAAEVAVDDIRRRFGYRAIGRALFLKDRSIGLLSPKDDHTVHPVGYLQNATMDSVIGRR
ncbi:MAG: DNA polymerase IV [Clostridiales bacterium]|nr:DNA polymerase IV [Clostridiales bacterium]